jgi:hypothetical protein
LRGGGRGRLYGPEPQSRREHGGAAPVGLPEPQEVRREGPEAAEQPGHERVFVGRGQQRVGGPLGADRAGARRAHRGGAERARSVRWPDRDVIGQLEQAVHGPVLGAGELLGASWVDQVGAGDRADHQGSACEDARRPVAIEEQERQVLVGVPGSAQRAQPEATQVELVAVAEAGVVEGATAGGRRDDGRAVGGGELAGTGEEVGVQMGVRGVRDPQRPLGRDRPQLTQVATGVDGQRSTVAEVDEVGGVAEAVVGHRHDGRAGHAASVGLAGHLSTVRRDGSHPVLVASTEMLLTPYVALALRAWSEMNA